ncbi:MAG: class II fructose-bisphosphate aldolase, partial [Candidatus Brocadiae bacterium]|nr:class II fructose-bisphosphate aldolase [Candidatus Brocadiia bacterium]
RQAVPLFVCCDIPVTEGVIRACEAIGSPAILGLWPGLLTRPGGTEFAKWIQALAGQSSAPLSLMLDHGKTVEQCLQALSLGFTDVMYDGSILPFQENLANTRRVVEAARRMGAAVEAELGIVGSGSDYAAFAAHGEGLTDPQAAERFASESGCDLLAVAVGTAHGQYNSPPQLDLGRLRQIRQHVEVPLTLHGGSGLSDAQFRSVISNGISKINIGTDLVLAAGQAIAEESRGGGALYFRLGRAAREAVSARAQHYLKLFRRLGRGRGPRVLTSEGPPR